MRLKALCERAHDLARPFLTSTALAVIHTPPYIPASAQAAAFHQSNAKIRAVFGGNRAGKSECGGYELVRRARLKIGIYWACAMSQDFLKVTAGKLFKYLAEAEIETIAWNNSARRIPAMIRLKNGSEIEMKTYKSGIEAFAGQACEGVWLDEDPALAGQSGEAIFVECLQRTVDTCGKLWLTATPVLGRNWMFKRIYSAVDPDIQHWTVSLLDNTTIPLEEKERNRRLLTQDEIDRRFYGLFTTLEGAVFKEINPDLHFIQSFPIPASWQIIRGIDLGYVNPFCCLWGAFDGDHLYIFLEHYQAETLIADHARLIESMESNPSIYKGAFRGVSHSVADHERQTRAELDAHNIFTIPAQKDWSLSIELINRLFRANAISIFRDRCPHLCEELQLYRYGNTADGRESPVKENDHAVDAFRYLCMDTFGGMLRSDGGIESVLRSEFAS